MSLSEIPQWFRKTRAGQELEREQVEAVASDRAAAVLEKELREGGCIGLGRIGWPEFIERYTSGVLPGLAQETTNKAWTVLNAVGEICRPKKLADLTGPRLSRYAATLRERGRSETTVKAHLAHLRPMLKWAIAMGWLRDLPTFPKTHRAKAGKVMKGRPVTSEEFERMLGKTPGVVGKASAESWRHFLTGLWWRTCKSQAGTNSTPSRPSLSSFCWRPPRAIAAGACSDH